MVFTSSIPIRTKIARRSPRSGTPKWLLIVAEIAVPILLLVLWWVVSAGSTSPFFPPLQAILEHLIAAALTSGFWFDIGVSLGNLFLSFVLATVIGVVIGGLLGLVPAIAWLLEPVLHFFRAIPPVALIPIFVSLIGFGNETRVLSITISALFPVLISTVDGIRGTEPTLGMVSRVYRFGIVDRLLHVTLPAAGPRILAGMQVSLIAAFVVMIASEMMGSSDGLGARVLIAQQSFAVADMWGGILVLGIIGYVSTALFTLFRRRVLRWYIASQQQEKNS